ncbi:MAG: PAS domain S-box protein, partial [Bacteroidota bacterium]|nr:PAS domain S-box protein [Bacteroidota bacterium]
MKQSIRNIFFGTLRRRLIFSVALIHAVMMTVFIADLIIKQQRFLVNQQEKEAMAFADNLAVSVDQEILANDVNSLQELTETEKNYPEINYIIITNKRGLILAHSDRTKVGKQLLGIPITSQQTIRSRSQSTVDILKPVMVNKNLVGWIRIGLGQKSFIDKLNSILLNGILYTITAVFLGALIAWMVGASFTKRLNIIQKTIDDVAAGNITARSSISGNDEAAVLAKQFNEMLDLRIKSRIELQEKVTQLEMISNNLSDTIIFQGVRDDKGKLKYLYLSEGIVNFFGKTANEIINDPSIIYNVVYEDDRQKVADATAIAFRDSSDIDIDIRYYHVSGELRWAHVRSTPRKLNDGKIIWDGTYTDITQRKLIEKEIQKTNRITKFIGEINELILLAKDENEIYGNLAKIAVEKGHFIFSWVGIPDIDTKAIKPHIWAGKEEGYLKNITVSAEEDTPYGKGPVGKAYQQAKYYYCNDIEHDPAMKPWKEAALQRGYNSLIAFPLMVDAKIVSIYAMYAATPDFFNEEEVELLIRVTNNINYALTAINNNRKRNEGEIQIKKITQAIEQSSASIIITDLKPSIEYVNPAFTELTGYSYEEAIGKNPRILQSGITLPSTYRNLWQNLSTGIQWQGELCNRKKNGELYWEQAIISPITNAEGEITNYVAIKENITERKKMEELLKEDEQMLNTVFEKSPIGKLVYDKKAVLIKANKKAEEIFGTDANALIGIYNFKKDPNFNFPEIWKNLDKGILLESSMEFDFNKVIYPTTKTGVSYLHFIITPISEAVSKNIGYIVQVDDVTEKRLNEQKISKAIIKAQEEERYEIGGELHDNVCQILVGAQMNLGIMNKSIAAADQERYKETKKFIKQAIDDIRNLSHNLAPALVDASKLDDTYNNLIRTYHFNPDVKINLHTEIDDEKIKLDQQLLLNLYRIL